MRQLGVVCAALLLGGCATTRTVTLATAPAVEWRGLIVAGEHRCAPYRSDEYAYPQAVEDDIIQRLGGLFSPYTNEVFDSKGDTDIEHVVARSEAHDSGLCRADTATKRAFSRDLLNLTLASPRVEPQPKGREGCGRMAAGRESVLVRADRCGRAPGLPTDDRPA